MSKATIILQKYITENEYHKKAHQENIERFTKYGWWESIQGEVKFTVDYDNIVKLLGKIFREIEEAESVNNKLNSYRLLYNATIDDSVKYFEEYFEGTEEQSKEKITVIEMQGGYNINVEVVG